MQKTKKQIAVILSAALLLLTLLLAFSIIEHAAHNCTGGHCEVCHYIHTATQALKQAATPLIFFALALSFTFFTVLLPLFSLLRRSGTLVTLKVQLNS